MGPPRPSVTPNAQSQSGWTAPPFEHSSEKTDDTEDFDWELEKIFAEEIHKDADPIGRPLPNVYDEEPILPPSYNASAITCKYVRPNNLEIFARDIRLSLHWPSLRADPVFSDISYSSLLIPLHDIESWIQRRQNRPRLEELMQDGGRSSPSRKRAWSEEQDDNGQNINQEAFPGPDIPKMQRDSLENTKDVGSSELVTLDRAGTPTIDRSGTPAFRKSGTPSFGVEDDAWAPQPGEGQITTSPVADPTEALLASLGVTGTPKPISQNNSGLHMSPVYME